MKIKFKNYFERKKENAHKIKPEKDFQANQRHETFF